MGGGDVAKRTGVHFRSQMESIDATTPTGQLAFHAFAALAEFERSVTRERTKARVIGAQARDRSPEEKSAGRCAVTPRRRLSSKQSRLPS